ncbi:unnamed protein product, partial [Coregonus sp. 'balchen']
PSKGNKVALSVVDFERRPNYLSADTSRHLSMSFTFSFYAVFSVLLNAGLCKFDNLLSLILCRTRRFNFADAVYPNLSLQDVYGTGCVCGKPTIMDMDIYQLWLDGLTVKVLMDEGALLECEVNAEVLTSDTMDQFRTFQMCERLLHFPTKLGYSSRSLPSTREY